MKDTAYWRPYQRSMNLMATSNPNLPPGVSKPITLFLFCSSTKAEKTWLAKSLVAARIDMREYREGQCVETDELFAVRHRV